METIKHKEFGGERPLYASHDLHIDHVTIHVGESSLKESRNIKATNCTFEGKYTLWCVHGFEVDHCLFTPTARSSTWYSSDMIMTNTKQLAPKMFRDSWNLKLDNVDMPDAQETFWNCHHIDIHNSRIANADYLFMHSHNIRISDYHQDGNYSFQYARNVEIHHAIINSKDSFWNAENVTVYDSEINGEYMAWHSKNVTFVRCHLTGTQPLCYAENLKLIDCTLGEDADLAFEYSSVEATIKGRVVSIKNPTTGHIIADEIGEIILDQNQRAPKDCVIETRNK